MKKRILSILLAGVLLSSLLFAGLITTHATEQADMIRFEDDVVFLAPGETTAVKASDPSAVYTSSDEDVVLVENDGTVTAVGVGTAEIYATASNGDVATAYITVTDKSTFTYRFDKACLDSSYNNWKAFDTITYGNTTSGHPDEIASYPKNPTDPWAYASFEGWYIDTTISKLAGAYSVWSKPDASGAMQSPGHFAIKIKVPAGAAYTPSVTYAVGSGWGYGNFYLAPADAEDPTASEYDLGVVKFASDDGKQHAGLVHEFEAQELDAGEYIVTVTHNPTGTRMGLMGWTAFTLEDKNAVTVSFDQQYLHLNPGDVTYILPVTVLPETLEDKSVTYSSNNLDVVEVIDNAICAMGPGTATVTATSNADPSKSASIVVYVGDVYVYDFVKTVTSMPDYAAGVSYRSSGTALESDYSSSIRAESAPWYIETRYNAADFSYYSGNDVYGVFLFGGKKVSGPYIKMKIKVLADGLYTGELHVSDYSNTSPFFVYLAPVGAADPMASGYKILDYTPDYGPLTQKTLTTKAVYLTEGEYYLTFYQNGSTNSGYNEQYLTTKYFALKQADLGLSTTNGASIRIREPMGMRFLSGISNSAADLVAEYGTILLPTAALNGDENNLVVGYTDTVTGYSPILVPAVYTYDIDENNTWFSAVLTNISTTNYNRSITARAYAKLHDGTYIYGTNFTSRSILEVAENGMRAHERGDVTLSDDELEIFSEIIEAAE